MFGRPRPIYLTPLFYRVVAVDVVPTVEWFGVSGYNVTVSGTVSGFC